MSAVLSEVSLGRRVSTSNRSDVKTLADYVPSAQVQELLDRPYEMPGSPDEDIYLMGISGGVDSCAQAVLMTLKFPKIKFLYTFTDTGADHSATYETLDKFESFLGVKIDRVTPEHDMYQLIDKYNGYLPSANARYCTKSLKIEPLKKTMALIAPFMSMAIIHSFVGLRADEPSRVGFETGDPGQKVHFPLREMGLVKADVFKIMSETIGIPRFYATKTRSGCAMCFFQRKSELTQQVIWFPKDHAKAKSVEKLNAKDLARFVAKPTPATQTLRVARNWLQFPLPSSWDYEAEGVVRPLKKLDKVERQTHNELFVAVEYELGTPFFGEPFVGFAQIVATSRSAAGIKKQVNGRWEHLLDSLWMRFDDEEQVRRDVRYVIYQISAPAHLMDTSDEYEKDSYTLHQFWSLEQAEHWVAWAESALLHASTSEGQQLNPNQSALHEMTLYQPKDPVINDLVDTREEEIAEEGEAEGSRAICWACSI